MNRGVAEPAFFNEPMIADERGMPSDHRFFATSWYRLKFGRYRQCDTRLDRARQDGAADRMLRSRLETGRDLEDLIDGRLVQRNHVDDVRHSLCERSGLVERDALDRTNALEV